MAIDTQAKRLSITHLLVPSYAAGGWADGTVDQADRQSFMWIYSGSLIGITLLVLKMNVYVPAIQMSVSKPAISITVKAPSIKVSVTKEA